MTSAERRRRPTRVDRPKELRSGDAEAALSDELVESLIETFPASDPPSWTALTRVGPPHRKDPRRKDPRRGSQ
jgi:hypothetical protein